MSENQEGRSSHEPMQQQKQRADFTFVAEHETVIVPVEKGPFAVLGPSGKVLKFLNTL